MAEQRLSLHGAVSSSANAATNVSMPDRAKLAPDEGCAVCRVRCEECRGRHVALIVELSGQLSAERERIKDVARVASDAETKAVQMTQTVNALQSEKDERVAAANIEAATALEQVIKLKDRLERVLAHYYSVADQARKAAEAVIGITNLPMPSE